MGQSPTRARCSSHRAGGSTARSNSVIWFGNASSKKVATMSGASVVRLRSKLINQLNHWGFHKWLGLGDSANLFSTSRHLVQTTSLLRYPVFVKDDDYRGSPDMTKHPPLRKYLLENFVA